MGDDPDEVRAGVDPDRARAHGIPVIETYGLLRDLIAELDGRRVGPARRRRVPWVDPEEED